MGDWSIEFSGSRVHDWLRELTASPGEFAALLALADGDPAATFRHTIREICQQPATWSATARYLVDAQSILRESLQGCERVVLTGSGSSKYAGDCAASALASGLGKIVEVVGGGDLLLRRRTSVDSVPTLVISLARSGDSPESTAVIETLLEAEPQTRHLIITCNANGRLARQFAGNPRVRRIALSEEVNDRSLAMTSSFSNLVLSARFPGWLDKTGAFVAAADRLSLAGRELLKVWPDRLAAFVSGNVGRAVFLGDGSRFGAACEGALKLLEMTGGRIATMAETYLGLRHGPVCFIDSWTLVVCFLSSDPLTRRYEQDVILELSAKHLGMRKLIAGAGDAGAGLCRGDDLAIRYQVLERTPDDELSLLDVIIAQLLGFHRCRQEGLAPDSPSFNDVISRVVGGFRIHGSPGARE